MFYEIWPDSMRARGPDNKMPTDVEGREARMKALVEEHGLRAKLQSVSLVTGQYMVSLVLDPESKVRAAQAKAAKDLSCRTGPLHCSCDHAWRVRSCTECDGRRIALSVAYQELGRAITQHTGHEQRDRSRILLAT